jgi:hypothetical protein
VKLYVSYCSVKVVTYSVHPLPTPLGLHLRKLAQRPLFDRAAPRLDTIGSSPRSVYESLRGALVDLLRNCRGSVTREEVYRLLQPKPLDPDPKFGPAMATIRAALELGLAEEGGGTLSLSVLCKREKNTRSAVLKAFDERVLARSEVEKYFALFYAYYLGLGQGVYERRELDNHEWANRFNQDVFDRKPQNNPFNATKLTYRAPQ